MKGATALAGILAKYRAMHAMRLRDAADPAHDPRREMAALSQRFPGALREIDRRPLEDIEARLRLLETLGREAGAPPRWVSAQAAYHGAMRAALRVRPGLRGCATLEEALAWLRAGYRRAEADEPDLAGFEAGLLPGVWRPAGGRLNPAVCAYVAAQFGVGQAELDEWLFGAFMSIPS